MEVEFLKLGEYCCRLNLNLYDSPSCTTLATQAAAGRHLRFLSSQPVDEALEVCLCEDDYSAWLKVQDVERLEPVLESYEAIAVSQKEIDSRLEAAIAFTHNAMKHPNYYLWGGTVGPNYDCSGLMQAAFASVGIWLPRDSYQQQMFTQPIPLDELLPGDLVFFASEEKINHVGLYLGGKRYIHSSGKETGNNCIGINILSELEDKVSQCYYWQFRGGGRVVRSYEPQRQRERVVTQL